MLCQQFNNPVSIYVLLLPLVDSLQLLLPKLVDFI